MKRSRDFRCPKRLLLLLSVQALLSTGCTVALWEEDRFVRYHQPADPPNLRLYRSIQTKDLLVQYDETKEGSDSRRERVYWLNQNSKRIAGGRKPRFIEFKTVSNLEPVPVFSQTQQSQDQVLPEKSGIPTLYAVAATNTHSFSLYSANKEISHQNLPAYYYGSMSKAKKVALTPVAVAIDAAICALIIAVIVEANQN